MSYKFATFLLCALIGLNQAMMALACPLPSVMPYPKSERAQVRLNECTIDIHFEAEEHMQQIYTHFDNQLQEAGYVFAHLISEGESHFYALYKNEVGYYTTLSLDRTNSFYRFEIDLKARAPHFLSAVITQTR